MKKLFLILSFFVASNVFAVTPANTTITTTTTTVATDLDISTAWARPTWGDPKTTAIYMKITNKGKDNYLLSASTDVAKTAEIHQTVVENEVAHMAAVQKIAIPALNTVSFEPGGIHIMLVNVSKDLKVGDTFDLKLQFENGGERIVKVLVQDNTKNTTVKSTTTTTTTN